MAGQYKLITTRRLDYEVETTVTAVVVCSDQGRAPLTTRVNISVAILDANDNAPRFQQSRYVLHVAENKPADFVVEQVDRLYTVCRKKTSRLGRFTVSYFTCTWSQVSM